MQNIDEEIHPRLIETWKQFDEKVRSLGLQYDTAADEALKQAFFLPFRTDNDKTMWKGIADFMYDTKNIKDGLVLLKIDPGYKKGEVLFSFVVAAINDNTDKNSQLHERILGIFTAQPHITLNLKPTNGPELGRLPKEDNIHKMPVEVQAKFNEYIVQDENILKSYRSLQSQCGPEIANEIEDILRHRENIIASFKKLIGN